MGTNLIRVMLMASASISATVCISPATAHAQEQSYEINIPAQPLGDALRSLGRSTRQTIVFDGAIVRGKRSVAVRGRMTPSEALGRMIANSDLMRSVGANGVLMVRVRGAPGNDADASLSSGDNDIVVTGTRIKGADTPSPVVRVTEESIREAGFNDIGEVIRSIPQNFAGGQNPGIALGSGFSSNITGGSAFNLRGLGPDATLTLLNGRRLSYGGFQQAVDASLVPVAALQRIEVITDGASALYGSDAVAGVANIIVKRDFEGLTTAGRIGFATEGGGTERQLSATTGTRWGSGGIIAAYNYLDADPIFSSQRSYTDYMLDPSTLMSERRNHNGLISAHQKFFDALEFKIDALYTDRYFRLQSRQPAQLSVSVSDSKVYAVSPTLELSLPADWTITAGGTYSVEENIVTNQGFNPAGTLTIQSITCYCNKAYSLEASAEGPLFRLPGGAVRLATGVGYRNNDYVARRPTGQVLSSGDVGSRYAFGEINIPVVAPDMGVAIVHRLSATAAVRYEDYSVYGSITTPKLGIIYQPSPDVTLKGSWGRSFKAPTLQQRFSDYLLYIRHASVMGGTGYPATATVLTTAGGSADLKPEKARTWSATLSVQPRILPGLTFDVTYFDIDYRGRVITPIGNLQAALSDPAFAGFITLNPTAQQIADAAAPAVQILNATNQPLTPSTVVAIVDNRSQNVARQRARGIDVSGGYDFDLGGGRIALRGSASWLSGNQRAFEGRPTFPTAGIIYNPAKFRARGGVVWHDGGFMMSGFINHVGSVTDNRFPNNVRKTGSFTTADAVLRYQTGPGSSFLSNLDLSLSAQNVFDKKPPTYQPLANFIVNYDSTNYSAIGRYVSFSISKGW